MAKVPQLNKVLGTTAGGVDRDAGLTHWTDTGFDVYGTTWEVLRDDAFIGDTTLRGPDAIASDSGSRLLVVYNQAPHRSGGDTTSPWRMCLCFDTSDIQEPPSEATLSIVCRSAYGSSNVINIASDHRLVFARPVYPMMEDGNILPLEDDFQHNSKARNSIDGYVVSGSFENSYVGYTDPFLVTSITSNLNESVADYQNDCTTFTFTLNQQARRDMAENDIFGMFFLDYDYDVRYRDPMTNAPSAGSQTLYRFYVGNAYYSGSTNGDVYEAPAITYKTGVQPRGKSTPSRIREGFVVHGYSDISEQRRRYVKDCWYTDQVPYHLAVKGPLSLRGRANHADGTPLTTAAPAKVTSGGDD